MNCMQKVKELINLSNLYNFHGSLQAILQEISAIKKLRNCCVATKLMSHTFSVRNFEFLELREFLRKDSVYWTQIFTDN